MKGRDSHSLLNLSLIVYCTWEWECRSHGVNVSAVPCLLDFFVWGKYELLFESVLLLLFIDSCGKYISSLFVRWFQWNKIKLINIKINFSTNSTYIETHNLLQQTSTTWHHQFFQSFGHDYKWISSTNTHTLFSLTFAQPFIWRETKKGKERSSRAERGKENRIQPDPRPWPDRISCFRPPFQSSLVPIGSPWAAGHLHAILTAGKPPIETVKSRGNAASIGHGFSGLTNLFAAPMPVVEPRRRLYSLVGNLLSPSKLVLFMGKLQMVMNLDPQAW